MIIKELWVKNYRCFGDKPTKIEFSDSGVSALIGPNNIGKSTVLKILEILLGEKWPTYQINEDDFHNYDLSKEIILACLFREFIAINTKNQEEIRIKGVLLRAKFEESGYGENSIETDYKLLKSEKNIENLNYNDLDVVEGYINSKIKNQLPLVITIPLVKLQTEQPTNKWSILGRMLQKVENSFIKNQDQKSLFENNLSKAVEILKTEEFKDIENKIKDSWNKMKPVNLTETEIKFLDYDPWHFYRQFKLSIKQNERDVPVESLGEGVQRLAVIALYRTYLNKHERSNGSILLIEEPESYLHPQARKNLFRILKEILKDQNEKEGQIVFTTHSENFIDCSNFDDILIFSKNEEDIEVRHITEEKLRKHTIALGQETVSNQRVHYKLIESISSGLKESLFANKAIIVEGPSEVELLKFFSDAEKEQIGIVCANGKGNIPAIYTFLTAFGIPTLIIMDRDSEDKTEEENDKLNGKITKMINVYFGDENINEEKIKEIPEGEIWKKGPLMVFSKNLESVFNKKIENWDEVLKQLRKTFNLSDKNKIGPRDMAALGLVFRREFKDENLAGLIDKIRNDLEKIEKEFNNFIKQEVRKPNLLKSES